MIAEIQAENCIVGASLVDNSIMPLVAESLVLNDFQTNEAKQVLKILFKMYSNNEPIDLITISKYVKNRQALFEYLQYCITLVPTTAGISNYIKQIKNSSKLKLVQDTLINITPKLEIGADADEIADEVISTLNKATTNTSVKISNMKDLVCKLSSDLNEKMSGKIYGISTGFKKIDSALGRLQNGNVYIIAARPGMGKTGLALRIAENIAFDKKVLFFSLEMPESQLVERLMSMASGVPHFKIRDGMLNQDEVRKISGLLSEKSKSNLVICDKSAVNINFVKSVAKREKDLSCIVIDYLQLMTSITKTSNRESEVSEISRSIKAMAKDLDVPVIILAQLNRANEQRKDRKPALSDLRESGSIEQDADAVMMLHRESYYNEECDNKDECECIINKNRHGATGTVILGWKSETINFYDLE